MDAVKEFIKNYLEYIQDNDWDYLYKQANYCLRDREVGELTSIMLECNINPLLYMERVPNAYMSNVKKPLISIYIPDNIKYINANAFYGCEITSLHIPKSVTHINNDIWALPKNVPIHIPYSNFEEFAISTNLTVMDWNEYIFVSSITGKRIHALSSSYHRSPSVAWSSLTTYSPTIDNPQTLKEILENAIEEFNETTNKLHSKIKSLEENYYEIKEEI